jgi:hypothetical protein
MHPGDIVLVRVNATKPRSVACFIRGFSFRPNPPPVAGATMRGPNSIPLFRCSSCFALYQVTKAQAGPETVDLKIACRVCGEPLVAREGQFVLKYFLLRKATRLDVRRARQGFLRAKPAARRRKASVSSIKK